MPLRLGPAPVHKLGHFGMCVTDFAKTYEFYTSRFNFVPSDVCSAPHETTPPGHKVRQLDLTDYN